MIEEDPFVELAKTCVRTCHVLKAVTDGNNILIDGSSGPGRWQIEDLGKCVDPVRLPSAENDE